jgi:hypothetical protein
MDIGDLQKRYERLFGNEPTASGKLEELEKLLDLRLPDDLRSISRFYSGGMIGRKSLNSISPTGPATNIGEATVRFRKMAQIPESMVVLAELDDSFIVLDAYPPPDTPAVYWCDSGDVFNLSDRSMLRSPQTWRSYSDFFESLLDDEEGYRRQHNFSES